MDTMTNNNNAILLVLLINKKVQQKISPYAGLLVPESSYLVDM